MSAVTAANPKAGSVCPKAGTKKVYQGKTYTCIKSGKKLVWSKGVTVIAAPKPSVTPTPSPTPNPSVSASPTAEVSPSASPSSSPSPTNSSSPTPTPSRTIDPKKPRELDACQQNSQWKIGYNLLNFLVYLSCGPDGKLHPQDGAPQIDQDTGLEIRNPILTRRDTAPYVPLIKPLSTQAPKSLITPRIELSEVSACKVASGTPNHQFTTGFPIGKNRARLDSNPTIQVIAIDFPDLQGKRSPKVDHEFLFNLVSTYWSLISNRKFTINWDIPDSYVRMPKNVVDYGLGGDLFAGTFSDEPMWNYVRAAIAQTDSIIDFTGKSMIAVITPSEATSKQIGTLVAEARNSKPFSTREGDIYNVFIMGNNSQREDWRNWNWVHEFGHLMGLTDLRDVRNPGAQNSDALGIFDLFSSSMAPELLGWSRFLLGALADSQIRCVANGLTSTHLLYPVAELSNREKLLVIPISQFRAIAVESRRQLGFDSNLGYQDEGAIVYAIDTSIPFGTSAISIIGSPRQKDSRLRTDSALREGESVTHWGYKITNVESGEFGDVVRVERA